MTPSTAARRAAGAIQRHLYGGDVDAVGPHVAASERDRFARMIDAEFAPLVEAADDAFAFVVAFSGIQSGDNPRSAKNAEQCATALRASLNSTRGVCPPVTLDSSKE